MITDRDHPAYRDLGFKVEQGLRLRPSVFGPHALENVRTLYLEDRIDVAQFEEDVEAILAVMAQDEVDPLDLM